MTRDLKDEYEKIQYKAFKQFMESYGISLRVKVDDGV